MADEIKTAGAPAAEPAKKRKTKNPRKRAVILVTILVVVAAGGFGFWKWHETPQFCAAICHNMDQYLTGYEQDQGVAGVDKYGNTVSDTNAMMAVLHRSTQTPGKEEIRCMGCHHPVIGEQISEGISWITGNYMDPLDERVGGDLTHWWKEPANNFCSNGDCHADLLGADGVLDYIKLAKLTATMDFNPHNFMQHDIALECTDCHKGHRASTVVCTGCHQHENIQLPEGWVTYAVSEAIMRGVFRG